MSNNFCVLINITYNNDHILMYMLHPELTDSNVLCEEERVNVVATSDWVGYAIYLLPVQHDLCIVDLIC